MSMKMRGIMIDGVLSLALHSILGNSSTQCASTCTEYRYCRYQNLRQASQGSTTVLDVMSRGESLPKSVRPKGTLRHDDNGVNTILLLQIHELFRLLNRTLKSSCLTNQAL